MEEEGEENFALEDINRLRKQLKNLLVVREFFLPIQCCPFITHLISWYNMVMLWRQKFFTMEFYKEIIGKMIIK